MKTYAPKRDEVQHNWYVVDATGHNLGRLASDIARVLRGKHKPMFAPNTDVGDFVIVINAEKIAYTGKKLTDKTYYRHSGYPGGLREISLGKMLDQHPERVLTEAIRGMLPHNRLGAAMFGKLKVYAGAAHPHGAQQPADLGDVFVGQKSGANYTTVTKE